jgi:Bleomycin resistance protein-like N-terminal
MAAASPGELRDESFHAWTCVANLKAPKPEELDMSSTQVRSEVTPRARGVDMKLEVVVIPVSDVDRAKEFYGSLGWRLDADFAAGDDWR